jgi:hypothetical protein
MLFPNKPTRVLPARVSKQANVKRAIKTWKCGKTKVATMNGNNTRFPNLPKNRTGWTVGTLRRDDGDVMQPYLIEWDVQPTVSNFVSYEEMPILVAITNSAVPGNSSICFALEWTYCGRHHILQTQTECDG